MGNLYNKKTVYTEEIMERLIKLSDAGFTPSQMVVILDEPQYTEPGVSDVVRAYRYAKAGDAEWFFSTNNRAQRSVKDYYAAKFNLMPPKVELVPPEPAEQETPAAAVKDDENTAACLIKLLEMLNSINGKLDTLSRICGAVNTLTARVDENTETLKQVINANADIIGADIRDYKDILNGIKSNTRKDKKQ